MIRKVTSLVTFLEFLLLIFVFLLFLLTNRQTLDFVLGEICKKYELNYEKAEGSLLTGVKLEKLYYKNSPFAKEVVVDWRILPLFYKRVSFSELKLSSLNVDTALKFSQRFQSNDRKDKPQKDNAFLKSIPFEIEAKKIYLSLSPYSYKEFDMKSFVFEIDDFKTNLEDFYIKRFGYFLKSNFLSLKIEGFLKDRNVYVKNLDAENIDLDSVLKSSLVRNKNENPKKSEKKSDFKEKIPIDGVVFEKISAFIKPYKYKEYEIKHLSLNAFGGFFDLRKYLYFDKLFLDFKTNVAEGNITGKIDQNKLFANSLLFLNGSFLERYSKDFDFNALNPVKAGFEVSKEKLRGTVFVKSKNLLKGELSKYDLKIKDMKTVLNYDFKKGFLHTVTEAKTENLYSKEIVINNVFDLNKTSFYKGNLEVKNFDKLPPEILKILKNLKISYEGKDKNLKGDLSCDFLKGNFFTKDFEKIFFNLENSKEIKYANVHLGAKLKTVLNLKEKEKSKINLKVFTDYGNVDSFIKPEKPLKIFSKITPAKKAKLKPFVIFMDTNISEDKIHSNIKSKILNGYFSYDQNDKNLKGELKIDSSKAVFSGNMNKEIRFNFLSNSFRELQDEIRKVYEFEKVPVDGEAKIDAVIDGDKKSVSVDVKSKWFLYEYEKNKFLVLENFKTSVFATEKFAKVKNYSFNVMEKRFFATKESDIYLNENNITVDKFFINDKAYVKGFYDQNHNKGKFVFKADRFKYEGEEGRVVFDADIFLDMDKDKKDIEGDVKIYEGVVTFEPSNEYRVNDKDIVIVQREKPKKKKKDNLSLNIHIQTVKPLEYKADSTDIKFNVDTTLWKEPFSKLQLLGMVKVLKGKVIKENKVFKIENGEVLFGGDASNPYLNLEISYEVKRYHITIIVTGTLESPVILFSSDPYLSQSDILSLILFGTTSSELMEGGGSASNQVVSMFGNTLAKELADSLGIKLDRLALSAKEDGSIGVEIGKKITRNITLIYKNDVVSTIVVEIEHSPKFETDITIKPNSSGIDFIYKKEY